MESLHVASFKSMSCKLFDGNLREQRSEWKPHLHSKNPLERCRDKEKDWATLSGSIPRESFNTSKDRVISVFLSSTLTDAALEKNFIFSDVLPFLSKCALNRGFDLHFSDMRKGFSDEHEGLQIETVLAEIENCQNTSAGINFILITGNKYGVCPVPNNIPFKHFSDLMDKISIDEAEFVRDFYRLDENCLGEDGSMQPRFVLVDIIENLRKDKERLATALRKAAINLWSDVEKNELRDWKR
jgi:hypothetical protein